MSTLNSHYKHSGCCQQCYENRGYKVYLDYAVLAGEMKRGMTIEFRKCRADLNFEVDFGVNGAIGTIVTKWDIIVFG